MAVNLDALDYLSKRFSSYSLTEISQLLIQNGNDTLMVEAILGDDLYSGSGEPIGSPRRNPPQTVGHPNVTVSSPGFTLSPTNKEGVAGEGFNPTSYGRMQSAPDPRVYSPYDRHPQQPPHHHQPVSRTRSLQQREYPRVGDSPSSHVVGPVSEYSSDPAVTRYYEQQGYIPSRPSDPYNRWSPYQPGYLPSQTPDKPRLELRVPSSGSGYSDWSAGSGSEQLPPGSQRMPSYYDPREYQSGTPSDYHPTGYRPHTPGDYLPLPGQDTRMYPSESHGGWSQTSASGHFPVTSPDLNYSRGRPFEVQPVYSIGNQQQYGAISPHGQLPQRPNQPLHLSHQTSHSSNSSSPGVVPVTGHTPPTQVPHLQQVMSPHANTPTQHSTPNEAYLQALLLHQGAQLETVRRLLESARGHADHLRRDNSALEHHHSQQVSAYSGIPLEDDLEIIRGEIQSLETSVDDLQRTLRSPQPVAGAMPQDQQDQEGPHWSCEHCSFLNHPALTRCEVCEIPKRRPSSERQMAFNL